jgi:ribosomal protein L22
VSPPDRTPPEGGWQSLKVDELKAELEARGLPKSGTKAQLVVRLEESDAAGEAAPEAPAAEPAEAEASAKAVPEESVAEEVLAPEEPAEEPSAEEVEEAEGPVADAEEEPEAVEEPVAEEEPVGEAEPVAEAEPEEPVAEAEELEAVEEPAAEEEPQADEEPEEDEEDLEDLDEDEDEAAADEDEALPAARRRGSVETSTGRRRAAPLLPEGDVVVRARSKYVRSAPRKARLVMDHIRGKEVEQARAILVHAPRSVAEDILKLLNSAVANAESNYELGPDELRIRKAFVDEGPTIKRYRPRALGRATRINKRTSHMTIELTTTGNGG